MRQMKRCKWVLMVGAFLFATTLQALTVSKTYPASSPSPVTVDGTGNYGVQLDPVTFSNADFYPGATIEKVTVSIDWTKTGGTCAAPDSENPYHGETSFRLDGPPRNVILAVNDTWSGDTAIGDVTTLFEQNAANIPSGTPASGTFKPNGGNLDNFIGDSPVGSWNLSAGDDAGQDPLCVYSYAISITVLDDTDTDGDTVLNSIDIDDDNDGILDVDENTCYVIVPTGYAISSSQTGGVSNKDNALGAPAVEGTTATNSNSAKLGNNDILTLTLESEIPTGTVVTLSMAEDQGWWQNDQITVTDQGTGSLTVGESDWVSTDTLQYFDFTVTAPTSQLVFTRDAGSIWVDGVRSYSYCTYPSYLDVDEDGISNRIDLDSDNDGIPDNVEAQTTTGYDIPSYNVNSNGFQDDVYGSGLVPESTDSDNIPDFLDYDSDNDRVSDCMEGNKVAVTNKMCPLQLSDIGGNGLDTALGGANDYLDVNGNVDDPTSDLFDFDTSTAEVSYREASICGNLTWELKANQWKTIAAPCVISSDIDGMFTAGLGTKCLTEDPNEVCDWVMYSQADFSGNANSGYTMLALTDSMNPSTGYWIISNNDGNISINDGDYSTSEAAKVAATNHSVTSSDFTDVFRTGTVAADATEQKFLLGHPFSGQLILKDLFMTGDDGANYYPMTDSANIDPFLYSTVYVYDNIGTDVQNYVAKTPGTPGFDGLIENGIGFWLGAKADSGATIGTDFPYYIP